MSATIIAILVGIGSFIVAVAGAYFKGRQSGKTAAAVKTVKKNAELQTEFDRIDSDVPDLDASLDRLRKRAGDGKS